MAFTVLVFLLVILVIVVAAGLSPFIIYPVCRAFRSGLIAVRDPAFRVTPQNPWKLMHQILWRRLRWWIVGWSLVLVLYIDFFARYFGDIYSEANDSEALALLLVGLSIPAAVIGLGSLLATSCTPFAARLINSTFLVLTTWLTGSLAYLVLLISVLSIIFALTWAGLGRFVFVGYSSLMDAPGPPGDISFYFLWMVSAVLWSLPISVAIAILIWRSAHKKGEKWFRFEE